MILVVAAALSLSSAQHTSVKCNVVSVHHGLASYAIELGGAGGGSSLKATGLGSGAKPIQFFDVSSSDGDVKFKATIAGVRYKGRLWKGFLGRAYSTLDMYGEEGAEQGVVQLTGICGNYSNFVPVVSRSQSFDVIGQKRICAGVTYSGRPFTFSLSRASDTLVFESDDLPGWDKGGVKTAWISPPMPPSDDGIYYGFGSFRPVTEGDNAPSGVEMFYLNRSSMMGATALSFNYIVAGDPDFAAARGLCAPTQYSEGQ
ncbi:hypothetical protein TPR58_07490 [Sphingomonas sp. HF-S3]|uniref:DUF3472 domain-containing protein n=1 Tax=Sphingomonas rustica TaxID=3103142 RepID=A0ABV0B609_9SPHN